MEVVEKVEAAQINTESTSLTVSTEQLKQESQDIVSKLVVETDANKTKDLTYLFNQNQTKRTIARQNKLNDLQDLMVDNAIDRFTKRPDEIDNSTLLQGLKTVQDMIDRNQKQVSGTTEPQPMIQINQQNNEINVGESKPLTKESRDKLTKIVSAIMGATATQTQETEPEIIDIEESSNGN